MSTRNNHLELGLTYLTDFDVTVTPIHILPNNRALFVSEEYSPTPFVSWSYVITDTNRISVYFANYYTTLKEALDAECDSSRYMRLEVSLYCPDCMEKYNHTIEYRDVRELTMQLEDARVMCPKCGYMWMGVVNATFVDDDTTYELPMWHGPTPECDTCEES